MRNIKCKENRQCSLEPLAQTGGGSSGIIATAEDYIVPLIAPKIKKPRKQARPSKIPSKKVQKGRGWPSTVSRKKAVKLATRPEKKVKKENKSVKKAPWTI